MKWELLRNLMLSLLITCACVLMWENTAFASWSSSLMPPVVKDQKIGIDMNEGDTTNKLSSSLVTISPQVSGLGSDWIRINKDLNWVISRPNGLQNYFTAGAHSATAALDGAGGTVQIIQMDIPFVSESPGPPYEEKYYMVDYKTTGSGANTIYWKMEYSVFIDLSVPGEALYDHRVWAQREEFPPTVIPEPATIISSLFGLAGFALRKFRG